VTETGPPGAHEPASGPLSAASSELVEQGDPDELTRRVNVLVADRDWAQLVALAARCRQAFARGKQLWAVAAHIEYRLALEAPGRWGAMVLETGTGRFAFGPLPEVAASTHTWAELAPHLHATPQAAMSAHERVLRGDDLTADPVATALPEVLDLPLRLEAWEPHYALAEYQPDKMGAPAPPLPPLRPLRKGIAAPTAAGGERAGAGRDEERAGGERAGAGRDEERADDERAGAGRDEVCGALEDLVSTWTEESNGRARAVGTTGSALDAIGLLGAGAAELAEVGPEAALAFMAWAAASGGAHGHRRGAAPGRFAAWWVLAALGGLTSQWPLDPDHLGEALHAVRWFAWAGDGPVTGWVLRLALEAHGGPHRGRSWAVEATDA
jgi:hypothetical protein